MTRVKRGVSGLKRRKNILKRAKGFQNRASTTVTAAKQALLKAGQHAYRDRKKKKADMRGLWLIRINAALKENGTSWSQFIPKLKAQGVEINRKMLSELAIKNEKAFDKLVKDISK